MDLPWWLWSSLSAESDSLGNRGSRRRVQGSLLHRSQALSSLVQQLKHAVLVTFNKLPSESSLA